MFCGVATFNKTPYLEVSMPGWVVDSKGEKMSKSVGNVVFGKDAIEELGADSLRFYYMWDIAPYELQMFNKETIKKEVWKIFDILINLNNYLHGLGDIKKPKITNIEDKWLLSKLNSLIENYNKNLDSFEYHAAARELEDFILNVLSRGYVHMIRERADTDNSLSYFLHEALSKILILLAPITPHLSESLFLKLKDRYKLKEESVHLLDWPESDNKLIDKKLEENFEKVKEIIASILCEREKIKMGIRWPLASVTITNETDLKEYNDVIKSQTNIKEIKWKRGNQKIELDTKLTKELEQEGYSREITRLIQNIRKEMGLKKQDIINVNIKTSYDLGKFLVNIREKVGAKILEAGKEPKTCKKRLEKAIKDEKFEIFVS